MNRPGFHIRQFRRELPTHPPTPKLGLRDGRNSAQEGFSFLYYATVFAHSGLQRVRAFEATQKLPTVSGRVISRIGGIFAPVQDSAYYIRPHARRCGTPGNIDAYTFSEAGRQMPKIATSRYQYFPRRAIGRSGNPARCMRGIIKDLKKFGHCASPIGVCRDLKPGLPTALLRPMALATASDAARFVNLLVYKPALYRKHCIGVSLSS